MIESHSNMLEALYLQYIYIFSHLSQDLNTDRYNYIETAYYMCSL